ncbi:unnamed protein product [Pseudo-nitzschia multistriata]|uniref:Vitamin K epoxide reductase domain-containing protein n=1 Tax=Pseudo-nitzschia multistriata TaxID=183589 RepID=A0A448ZQY7_9STRA|nr:unnamed protein product [Pseudo-nitzschia multistriata]
MALAIFCVSWMAATAPRSTLALSVPSFGVTKTIGGATQHIQSGRPSGIHRIRTGTTGAWSSPPERSNNEGEAVWSPGLRKTMAGVAGLGAVETGYLTYAKVTGGLPFCGSGEASYSTCDAVLNGPYAHLPFFEDLPLASLGFVAYASVAALALSPLAAGDNEGGGDATNRVLLAALATSMATFSVFLMTLLFGVLEASCPYCVFSACCSIFLAAVALIGGCLPSGGNASAGGRTVLAGFAGAVAGAVLLFAVGGADAASAGSPPGSTLAATISGSSRGEPQQLLYAPPEITTDSSERALALGRDLASLGGARMYGAHWCSHCYDQKQILGKQVFDKTSGFVEYVECSKDGINSQSKTCKAKEIPGYPTFEIQGQLYPGQQDLGELEDLVKGLKEASK